MSSSKSPMILTDLPTSDIITLLFEEFEDVILEVVWAVAFVALIVLALAILFVLQFCWRYCTGSKRENYEKFSNSPFKRGIRNFGNTCYFNAAIQCLLSTSILKSQVVKTSKQGKLTCEFLRFKTPIESENSSIEFRSDPKHLFEAFLAKRNRCCGTQQHDSHEFLRHFLDELGKEERARWTYVEQTKKLTAVEKVFGGHFMIVYICQKCKEPYHICEPFLDISVPICLGDLSKTEKSEEHQEEETETESASPCQQAIKSIMERLSLRPVDLPAKIMSITDCLRYSTRQDMLSQEYLCKFCTYDSLLSNPGLLFGDHILTTATTQTLIFNPPAVLVIHLKRFEMERSKFEKCSNMITFDELLDLAPFCSVWCQRNESREQNIWYSLYAVVVHSGPLNDGHYVAYVKERSENKDVEQFLQKVFFDRDVTADQLVEMVQNLKQNGRPTISTKCSASQGIWYCMDDSRVSRVSVDEVLKKEAFLLFYERVSPAELLR